MISVSSWKPDSSLVAEFRNWVESEWGKVDPFIGQGAKPLPAPILALEDGVLVGGLSFTYSFIPETQEEALWINTLLVAPHCRRRGIGSKLIVTAESSVNAIGVHELYVFTQAAEVYEKLNWRVYRQAEGGTTLRKTLRA